MKIFSICSGSKGNCIFVGDEDTKILIDIGITNKKLKSELAKKSIDIKHIDALLVTHEHNDHIKGLGVFSRKNDVKIYLKEKTLNKILTFDSLGKVKHENFMTIEEDESFYVNDFLITAFRSYHDAVSPVCYTIQKDGKKISVVTDLGKYDDYIKSHIMDSDILYIESNHDVRMLEVSAYPYALKQRILSDIGHLSNEQTASLICEQNFEKLKHIILGHLSEENNNRDIAMATVKYELETRLGKKASDINIVVALQNEASIVLEV